jgi:hypothetical protein
MDYGNMLSESFEYAKEAVYGKWIKWILLIIPFMSPGYAFQIYKGTKPAPEINDWIANFINGIKLAIVGIIYAIPIIVIGVIFLLPLVFAALSQNTTAIIAGIGSALLGVIICILLVIIVAIILPMAFIRFARFDAFGEAFNISEILTKIGTIGWGSYIIAWIVLIIALFVIGIIMVILAIIPLLGWIIDLLLMVAVTLFVARYWTQVYDSV